MYTEFLNIKYQAFFNHHSTQIEEDGMRPEASRRPQIMKGILEMITSEGTYLHAQFRTTRHWSRSIGAVPYNHHLLQALLRSGNNMILQAA